MDFTEIKESIEASFPTAIVSEDVTATPKALILDVNSLKQVCQFLYEEEGLYFDSLSCLTGIDNGPEMATMEVVYNLYSIPYDHHLMLKVELDRANPSVQSVESIWKTANWHEREAFDLVGIRFEGHPDLRRILLPNDWEGHPLRKDYEEQEKYHGMTVVYDRDDASDNGELSIENGKKD